MEKEKFADVFGFPEGKEEEGQIVGTSSRRLLSDFCFYLSFEVISFHSVFHIICFQKTGRGLSFKREEKAKCIYDVNLLLRPE